MTSAMQFVVQHDWIIRFNIHYHLGVDGISVLFVLLLGWFILPVSVTPFAASGTEGSLNDVLWHQRGLDVLVQVVLIFSGVLGLLGLLAEVKPPLAGSAAEEISAERDRELQAMEGQLSGQEEPLK